MRNVIGLLALFLVSGMAQAASEVCVRNYLGDDPRSPCVRFPSTYQFVVPAEGEKKICARVYPAVQCEMTKEYEMVQNARGGSFCTLNYHQPPVSRLCDDAPDYYDWAKGSENE